MTIYLNINDKPESLSISLEAFRLLPMLDLLWWSNSFDFSPSVQPWSRQWL